ncbi:MAG: hypothetical protein ACK5NT_00155 [Pyrinomonadaceae bacterium]
MKQILFTFGVIFILTFVGCNQSQNSNSGTNSTTTASESASGESTNIKTVPRPEAIIEKMNARGEQDKAKPTLTIVEPKDGAALTSSTVKINVSVTGDLKGIKEGKDDAGNGNHVHVILDNQPYAAHYMWNEGFELRNVTDGEHTLRMFVSRPWHESYKNSEAFKAIKFTVKNGNADEAKPTTDDKGNTLADAKTEGADAQPSTAGDVDFSKPLLTYSRPKGEYKNAKTEPIMLDFWLSNAKLADDEGEYTVRCTVNNSEPIVIKTWQPIWLVGWNDGKNTVKLELLDKDGKLVENGGYNSTTREVTVSN